MLFGFISSDSLTPSDSETSVASEARTSPPETGSSPGDSRARIFSLLVKGLGWRVPAPGSGSSTPASLASYDRDTRSWKTSELLLDGGSMPYSGALPKSGTMRNGRIYAPPMSERPTGGKESGLWPTPRAQDSKHGAATDFEIMDPNHLLLHVAIARRSLWPTPAARDWRSGCASQETLDRNSRPLNEVVRLWPTPRTAGMCGGTGNWEQLKEKCTDLAEARAMGAGNGGQLNPTWVEWLMGYPLGWTDSSASGIALSLKSQN